MADATHCTGQFTRDNEGHWTHMQLKCFCGCCISFSEEINGDSCLITVQKYMISEFRAGALFL